MNDRINNTPVKQDATCTGPVTGGRQPKRSKGRVAPLRGGIVKVESKKCVPEGDDTRKRGPRGCYL